MLSDLLLSQRALLAEMAHDWLSIGAEAFSIWDTDGPLACWPGHPPPGAALLVAPIQVGLVVLGELRVAAPDQNGAKRRLASEARMLARLLELEADLEQMTADLLDTQDHLLAMYELTQAMREHLGVSDALRRLARESARLVKTEAAVLFLPPTMVQYPDVVVDERWLLPYVQQVLADGREIVVSDGDSRLPGGISNLCMLPIRIRGSVAAALGLLNRDGEFTAPDLKLARAIAEQAGAQIENTLLHQETIAQAKLQAEMEVARKVQLQLLPHERPQVPGIEVFAESRPALHVGGDFYDFVETPNRPLMLVLGDVAGKGMAAALVMGMLNVITRNAARFMPDATPAAVLGRTNTDLYDNLTMLEGFATAFMAQYDMAERAIHYANAGHAPVIYRPGDGPARLLEGDGVPIGVLPMSLSENYTLAFGPGALLVVTTDGFNEARNPEGEMFGIERMIRLIDEFADQPAQVIAMALFDAVENFSAGGPQEDDQTLLVVRGVRP